VFGNSRRACRPARQFIKAWSELIPARKISPACGEAGSEDCIACGVCCGGPQTIRLFVHVVNFCLQDDGHNDAIYSHGLAENDTAPITEVITQ
jgi:hypothetical protein